MDEDGYFGERVAARYDETSAEMFEPAAVDPVVDLLDKLAGNGWALELGIGTGRIAIPLAQRGVPVHGIELSTAMVARLRAKAGGEGIGVTIGDFATATVDRSFSVAYLVFNTIMNLTKRLDRWDNAVRRDSALDAGSWRLLVIWAAARNAAVSGSTGIEGNPLDPGQVEEVLAGAAVEAASIHIREVENYNRALNLARDAALRPDFAWSHEFIHLINATVMDGLPRDTRGNYRQPGEEVLVATFTGPSPLLVQPLMDELVTWLRGHGETSPLVRSALLHLNLIAIHPFNDGNGRTARIFAATELVRGGVQSPELFSIEAYLRRNRDEYIDELRTTLGPTHDPDNHLVTGWLDYYTRISLDRLDARNRILDALPADLGSLAAELANSDQPLKWAAALLAARVSRLRTTRLAQMTGRSMPAARAELARIARVGWLDPQGATRGRWYAPSVRLAAVQLRVPDLMGLLAAGEQLVMFDRES